RRPPRAVLFPSREPQTNRVRAISCEPARQRRLEARAGALDVRSFPQAADASMLFGAQRRPSALENATEPSQKTDQGKNIEPVVCEHLAQRLRRPAAQKLKVQTRDRVARHVALAARAQDALLEGAEATVVERIAPHAPGRSHQVDVREAAGPSTPLKNEARLEQRKVEAAAVERHDAARAIQQRCERSEESGLFVEVAHEELRETHTVALDSRGADEKRVGPGAAGKPRRL